MRHAPYTRLLCLFSSFVAFAMALPAVAGTSNAVPGAIVEFNAGNNPGAPSNTWVNVGAGGNGGYLDGNAPFPTLVTDEPAHYVSTGGSFGANPPSGYDPYVTLTDFTYEIWLRRTANTLGDGEIQIAALYNDPAQNSQSLRFTLATSDEPSSSASLDFDIIGNGGAWDSTSGLDITPLPVTGPSDPFTQIAVAWDNATQQYDFYKNGALVAADVISATSAFDSGIPMGVWGVFKTQSTEGDTRAFPGDIALIRLYDRQLNDAEVLQNFNDFSNLSLNPGISFSTQTITNTAVVTFESTEGASHNLLAESDLVSGPFTNIDDSVTGLGGQMQMHDTDTASELQNYQVEGGRRGGSAPVLIVDFDASQGVTDDSGVTSWQATADGAVTPTATPPGAGNEPTLVDSIFYDGQPGINFNGEDQQLTYSDAGHPIGDSSFTIAMAFKFESLTPFGANPNNWGTWFMWGHPSAGTHSRVGMGSSPQGHFRAFNGGGTADTYLDSLEAGKNYAGIIVHDQSEGPDDLSVYLIHSGGMDSNVNTTFNHGPTDISLSKGMIGNILPVGDPNWNETAWNGYIGRIQVYQGAVQAEALTNLISEMTGYVAVEPPQVPMPPMITVGVISDLSIGDATALVYTSASNGTYRLQADTNNPAVSYSDVGAKVQAGDGGTKMFFDPTGYSESKNYRILETLSDPVDPPGPPSAPPTNLVFTEDFDGTGYTPDTSLNGLSPASTSNAWQTCCGTALTPDVSAFGYNGTQGAQRQPGVWGEGQIATELLTGASVFDFKIKIYRSSSDTDAGLLGIVSQAAFNAPTDTPSFIWLANDGGAGILNFRREPGSVNDIESTFSFSLDTWVELNVSGTRGAGTSWDLSAQIREYSGTTPGAWNAITLSGTNWDPTIPFEPSWATLNMIRHDANTAADDISITLTP
jgi:hypothetical protein